MPLTRQQLDDPKVIGAVTRLEFHAQAEAAGITREEVPGKLVALIPGQPG